MKTIKVSLLLGAFLIVGVPYAMSQSHPQTPKSKAIDAVVPEFSMTGFTLIEGVSLLSLQNIPSLHLSVEEILKERSLQQVDDHQSRFSIHVKGKSVRQILDLLCSSDGRYVWTQNGNTINVYPVATRDDPSYLMNLRLRRILVTDLTSPEGGLAFLDKQLPVPRQQLGYASGGGNSSYLKPWTQSWRDITVRQFINRLSEHMGDRTSWVLYGAKNERYFTFEEGGFH